MEDEIKIGDHVSFRHWILQDCTITGTVTGKYKALGENYLTVKAEDGELYDPTEKRCRLLTNQK